MTDEELERARKKVDRQTAEANKRATIAQRAKRWWEEQYDQNGFREMLDAIARGR